jgi:hypothetical protein
LYEEAERVARRSDAPGVSVEYVKAAATTIRLRRSSGIADIMLAIGPALTTLAGGVGVADVTATSGIKLSHWVVGVAYGAAGAGLLLTGAGVALKFKR